MSVLICYVRGFIAEILIYCTMLILGTIGLPFSLISKDWAYGFIRLYCRTCFLILRILNNIRIECRGEIPQGKVLVCSKHMSFLDILMLAYYLPRVSFVMKKEILFLPIIGLYGLRIGCVPVARGTGSKALNSMIRDYSDFDKKNETQQIVIYPQGTRVQPKEIKKYKIGAGVLYERLRLPCHLVGTNSGKIWPKGSFKKSSGIAVIEFFSVLQAGIPLNEFMVKMETDIEKCSNMLMEEEEKSRHK